MRRVSGRGGGVELVQDTIYTLYFSGGCYSGPVSENLNAAKTPEQVRWTQPNYGSMIRDLNVVVGVGEGLSSLQPHQ